MSGTDFILRDANTGDHNAIRRLHQITFDEHAAREPDFEEKPFAETFLNPRNKDIFFSSRYNVLVAEQNKRIAGYIAYNTIKPLGLAAGTIVSDITIEPDARRKGLGRALIAELERRETNVGTFAGHVWTNNTASQKLFEAAGYDLQATGTTPQFLARKSQKVSLRHAPLVLLTPPGVWLYAILLGMAETMIAPFKPKTPRTD